MKTIILRESQLRTVIQRALTLLRERQDLNNVVSIFRGNSVAASTAPTASIEIRGTVEFYHNKMLGVEKISTFLANILGSAAESSDGDGRWEFVDNDGKNISNSLEFDNFRSANGLALVTPFELIHPGTNHFKFFVEFLVELNEDDPRIESQIYGPAGFKYIKEDVKKELSGAIRDSMRGAGAQSIKINLY